MLGTRNSKRKKIAFLIVKLVFYFFGKYRKYFFRDRQSKNKQHISPHRDMLIGAK